METEYKTGDILPNGAVVAIAHEGIMLAHWRRGAFQEWVTWEYNDEGHTHTGHYFQSLLSAVADYEIRRKKIIAQKEAAETLREVHTTGMAQHHV